MTEGGFTGLKLRLGRDKQSDDLAAIAAVREAAGDAVKPNHPSARDRPPA